MICEMRAFIKAGRFRDASPCAISFSGAWFTTGLFWVTQTIGILPPGKGGFDTEMKKTGRVSNCRQPPCGENPE